MFRRICIAFTLICIASTVPAQEKNSEKSKIPIKDRIYFGGNLGLQFGNYTLIELSPLVGYRFTERFSSGLGLTYMYYDVKDLDYSTNIYGGRVFSRFSITESIFAHSEYELLNLEVFDFNQLKRRNVDALFIGGGIQQSLGRSGGLYLMVLLDIIEHRYSPYANPVIRVGFTAGL
ncbi:MAG TPA: hypothetical protein PKH65_10010 [Bacteroidia bacterium]|nr:hypothetical protein [Bacteroidia bacterium]HNT81004.1 hypothetical protein [Bacteroidia bacterium]